MINPDAPKKRHKPITEELIALFALRPEIKRMLEASIAAALSQNSDPVTNPVQDLAGYLDFTDKAVCALPWELCADAGTPLYMQIVWGACYNLFLIDQPLEELKGRGLWRPSLAFYPPFRDWSSRFLSAYRREMDDTASWNDEIYAKIKNSGIFFLDRGWYESPDNWHSFNDFFARRLASPDARPIMSPNDASVVVSPGDAASLGLWKINENSEIEPHGAVVKSSICHSAKELIGADSPYADSFAGGTFTHAFLSMEDYHRYHFPVGGVVREARIFPREEACGTARWESGKCRYVYDGSVEGYRWNGTEYTNCGDFMNQDWTVVPHWEMLEERGCAVVETEHFGLVAILPVGMYNISSVNFEENVKPGAVVKKGDPLGYFLFGGSDVIMMFQKNVRVSLSAKRHTGGGLPYSKLLMGQEYAKLTACS